MDFALSEEQRLLQTSLKEFSEKELRPRAHEVDVTGAFPWENVRKMAALGLFGLTTPPAYGGSGADAVSYAIASEELSRGCASTATILSAVNSLVIPPLVLFGTEAQKERWLPRLAAGEILGAFALSEPEAGSDAAALRTTAVKEGGEYVIRGRKVFCTCGGVSGLTVVFAVSDASRESRGITAFLVDTKSPGYVVEKVEEKMGLHGSPTASLVFEDLRVPEEARLGGEGEGFKVALSTLDGGRVGVAAMANGIARAALEESVAYAKSRVQFGRPIAEQQAVQWMLADMAVGLEAARLMVYRTAWLKDRGLPHTKEAAMTKLFATSHAARVAVKAVQVHGGYGYVKEYAVERFFRDIKVYEIFEGTNEIQRVVIARQLGLGGS
jgi:butyryl-CoA dehydrogenase